MRDAFFLDDVTTVESWPNSDGKLQCESGLLTPNRFLLRLCHVKDWSESWNAIAPADLTIYYSGNGGEEKGDRPIGSDIVFRPILGTSGALSQKEATMLIEYSKSYLDPDVQGQCRPPFLDKPPDYSFLYGLATVLICYICVNRNKTAISDELLREIGWESSKNEYIAAQTVHDFASIDWWAVALGFHLEWTEATGVWLNALEREWRAGQTWLEFSKCEFVRKIVSRNQPDLEDILKAFSMVKKRLKRDGF